MQQMWHIQAQHEVQPPVEEEYRRQGTAYRRARQLYAAGYAVTAVQRATDGEILGVYQFDGVRLVRVPRIIWTRGRSSNGS